MNLKSFGCSFIYGSELSDEILHNPAIKQAPAPSKITWPAQLARHLEYAYLCYARPGSGNLQIAERALTHLAVNEKALFVINWTYIDRFDYINLDSPSKWPGSMPWSTLMPIDESDIATTYFKELHSEIRDKLTTLMYVKLVIDTLLQKQFPFVMTYMDELMLDQRWHTTPAITELQEYIRPHLTTFDGLNFQRWAAKNGHAITSTGHPLDAAHAAAGKLMINVFDTQNTTDC
jgi:hypothetical protein